MTELKLRSLSNEEVEFDIDDFTVSGGTVHASYPLLSGCFDVSLHYMTPSCGGWFHMNSTIVIDSNTLTHTPVEVGYEGGLLKVDGMLGEGAMLNVHDQEGGIVHRSGSSTWFFVPGMNMEELSTSPVRISKKRKLGVNVLKFLRKRKLKFEYISDRDEDGEKAFDNKIKDRYSSTNSTCYAGIKLVSDDLFISLKSIKIRLQKNKNVKPEDYNGMRFEGSVDGENWELIVEYNDFHSAKHYHLKKFKSDFTEKDHTYRYLRYVHDSRSECSVNKIKWRGDIISNSNQSTFDVTINDCAKETVFQDAVTYLEEKTPIINDIEPNSGDYFGGYDITLTGENLGFAEAYV